MTIQTKTEILHEAIDGDSLLAIWCEPVRQIIRKLSQSTETETALQEITKVWRELDTSTQLAQARARMLMRKLTPPEEAPMPDWFGNEIEALNHDDEAPKPGLEEWDKPHPIAVRTTERLIGACLARAADQSVPAARLFRESFNRITIDWQVEGRLQWLVEATDAPYPEVKVYVLDRVGEGPAAERKTWIAHTAYELLDLFTERCLNQQQ